MKANEKPILFKPEMVRAILEGRKLQTRRLVKIQPPSAGCDLATRVATTGDRLKIGKVRWLRIDEQFREVESSDYFSRPYIVGDRLWVREQFRRAWPETIHSKGFVYRADKKASLGMDEYSDRHKWKPSIHMPRWACRLVLEITHVRVERLQDITESDAMAEGVSMEAGETDMRWNPVQAFQYLWNSIHSKDGFDWEKNPWVWVITFKRAEVGQ